MSSKSSFESRSLHSSHALTARQSASELIGTHHQPVISEIEVSESAMSLAADELTQSTFFGRPGVVCMSK